jgi:DNA-binding NarL/FixJ family response regulator
MFEYSEEEICSIYRKAKDGQDKIQLIHELTLKTKKEIIMILEKNGFEVEKRKPKRLREEKFLELYNLGINDRKISQKLHIPESTVRRVRNKLNLPPVSQNSLDEKVEAVKLHSEGLTTSEIAAKLNVRYNTIWHWLNELGLKGNKKSRQ